MYCSACGTPLAPGLSFCNRCGMSLKQSGDSGKDAVGHYLGAITVVGIAGLALMLGGAIALRNGANFNEDIVGVFMMMAFVIIGLVEFSLLRQLSRLNRTPETGQSQVPLLPRELPSDLRAAPPRSLAEPL